MQRRILLPLAAFLVLALCCSAVGAEAPESIEVSAGGVHYRLLVPEGHRLVPENSPEYRDFKEARRGLEGGFHVLALFVDEKTIRFLNDTTSPSALKYVFVCVPRQDARTPMTKDAFMKLRLMMGGGTPSDRKVMLQGLEEAAKQLGAPTGDLSRMRLDTPAEYALVPLLFPLGDSGKTLACVIVSTVLNQRMVLFYMYTLNDSPDALTNLAEEADAYARRYVDAGLVVFAPETQSVARTESTGGPASGSGGLRGEAPFVMQLLPLALMLGIVWLSYRLWRRFRRRANETASAARPANDDTPGTTPPGV